MMPLRWDVGDRCSHGNLRGIVRAINMDRRLAAVEFDHDPYVTVDVHLNELDLDWPSIRSNR